MEFDIEKERNRVFPFAWGEPPLSALIKQQPDDFQVREELGFEPDGEGEHLLVKVRKRERNTTDIVSLLAQYAELRPRDIGYSGLKDRNAVTEQWFSLWLGNRSDPDWAKFNGPSCTVITSSRHHRKLRRGSHKCNHFRIILRRVTGDIEAAEDCFDRIVRQGFPNYFGEQRFGSQRNNLIRVNRLFSGSGKIKGRHQRGLILSAARSWLFNRVLGERVAAGNWNSPLEEEVVMLDGSRSIFTTERGDTTVGERIARLDLHPTGPLCGQGGPEPTTMASRFEDAVLSGVTDWRSALEEEGLKSERRSLRARPLSPNWERERSGDHVIDFSLGRGEYATTLLREILE